MKPTTPRLDLNPSSADRWTTCTASPHFIMENWDKVPKRDDTRYNQEGTTAHEVAAALLEDREPNPAECPVPIDSAMRWHGWNYMEYVTSFQQPGSTLIVEQKRPLWYMPERNAKMDAVIINPDSLHVFDYKYGEGIPVHPEGNLQTVIYAKVAPGTEFMNNFPVFIHIYQPRGRAGETGPQHVWATTWGEVSEIAKQIYTKAIMIQGFAEDSRVFAPSDKACQWCPAKGFCTARRDSLAEGLEVIDAQPRPLPLSHTLSEQQLTAILKHKKDIVKWINDVEEWAESYLKSGGKIPGYKLVMSRCGNRTWSDMVKAHELLLSQTILKPSEIEEVKIIGPAAAEKLLGKNKFSPELTNLIVKSPGSPVIAPVEDKREEVGQAAISEFEVITDAYNAAVAFEALEEGK
jgi:hypothetical protein